MFDTQTRVSPVVAIAAVAVTIFSAVGVGVMTGVIPSSFSKNEQIAEPAKAPAKVSADRKSEKVATAPRKAASEPTRVAAVEPSKTAARACANCGTVVSVNVVKQEGEGSGLGAVAGGVVGGVLGNQVGQGRGRTAATVVGAGAGAYAGHEIEKHVKTTQRYDVAVRMEDGTTRAFPYETQPAFRVGDKVKIVEGRLVTN